MATKSKFFCVATEGTATDGRTITREWIQQMADTYNPKVYGARVWLEHIRGVLPDSPFKAYGDVVAVEAREKEDGKLGLYVQIEPTDELIALNKARQKIYSSMEIQERFADTDKAYLVGLGITDSPASLGTDMLKFTQSNPSGSVLTERKQHKDNLFSENVEVSLEFLEDEEKPSLSERIKAFREGFKKQVEKTDVQTEQLLEAIKDLAAFTEKSIAEQEENAVAQQEKFQQQLSKLTQAFEAFKKEVEQSDASFTQRPPATGGDGAELTDC